MPSTGRPINFNAVSVRSSPTRKNLRKKMIQILETTIVLVIAREISG
jgi:ribosomal protein S24E